MVNQYRQWSYWPDYIDFHPWWQGGGGRGSLHVLKYVNYRYLSYGLKTFYFSISITYSIYIIHAYKVVSNNRDRKFNNKHVWYVILIWQLYPHGVFVHKRTMILVKLLQWVILIELVNGGWGGVGQAWSRCI